ncbi:MAG TPA: hypothetical protein VFZ89_04345 [Solirubrobacteraceae bacterium]
MERLTRLRWRLRGAWQWPALWLLTLADAAVMHWLPYSGDDEGELLAGFFLAGFANLAIVAAVGPAVGRLLRRRRGDLPPSVAADRGATALMVALFAVLLTAGLIHRPAVRDADRDADRQLAAARPWFQRHAPVQFRAGIGHEDVLELGPDLFRTCIPGADPSKHLCVFVDTAHDPPTVREDPDERPNDVVTGPGVR